MGHSMGGGTAILVSSIIKNTLLPFTDYGKAIQKTLNDVNNNFKGTILICPVVKITNFSLFIRQLLSYVSYLFPHLSVPTFIIDENNYNEFTWTNPDYIKYIVCK